MTKDKTDMLLAQYTALRAEILARIDTRYRLVSYTIVLLGTMIALVIRSENPQPSVLFAYPVFAYLLFGLWIQNYRMMNRISAFMMKHVEPHFDGTWWESFNLEVGGEPSRVRRILASGHAGALFVVAQVIAMTCGFSAKLSTVQDWKIVLSTLSPLDWLWFSVGIFAILATVVNLCRPSLWGSRDVDVARIQTSTDS